MVCLYSYNFQIQAKWKTHGIEVTDPYHYALNACSLFPAADP